MKIYIATYGREKLVCVFSNLEAAIEFKEAYEKTCSQSVMIKEEELLKKIHLRIISNNQYLLKGNFNKINNQCNNYKYDRNY